jgi:hypothetical protein
LPVTGWAFEVFPRSQDDRCTNVPIALASYSLIPSSKLSFRAGGPAPSSRGVRPLHLPTDLRALVHSCDSFHSPLRVRFPFRFGRTQPASRCCSAFVVSHHPDGLLRASAAGLLHPAAGGGSPRFTRGRPAGTCPTDPRPVFLATRIVPPEELPSSAAAPCHHGRCLPVFLTSPLVPCVAEDQLPCTGSGRGTRSRRTGEPVGRSALPASSPRPSADLAIVRRVRVDARERLAGPAGPRLVGGGERTSAGIRCRAPGCDIAPVPVLAERLPDRRTQVLCAATWTSHAAHPVRRAVWRAINRRRCIIVTTAVSCCTCVRE